MSELVILHFIIAGIVNIDESRVTSITFHDVSLLIMTSIFRNFCSSYIPILFTNSNKVFTDNISTSKQHRRNFSTESIHKSMGLSFLPLLTLILKFWDARIDSTMKKKTFHSHFLLLFLETWWVSFCFFFFASSLRFRWIIEYQSQTLWPWTFLCWSNAALWPDVRCFRSLKHKQRLCQSIFPHNKTNIV